MSKQQILEGDNGVCVAVRCDAAYRGGHRGRAEVMYPGQLSERLNLSWKRGQGECANGLAVRPNELRAP